ncbi:hypothetical protein [Conexibacter sp. DBS9H8]|uniref:hypothetical protein n=1 Tax=Conexibacter sp. DBS9H8 TaxID=2937801 RepID=UPI00201069F3|nr:hypothetical protein [Conexibacter sp. DBS9H8]
MRALWRRYGAGPGHLLLSAACLAIAAAAVIGWTQRPGDLMSVLIWFAAAVLLHDLVALPLYSLLDRHSIGRLHPHLAVFLRVPALISGLVLLATFPTVLGFGAHTAEQLSGIREQGYLLRWLVLTAGLFALSAVLRLSSRRDTSTP